MESPKVPVVKMVLVNLADAIHVYPTYSTAVQRLAGDVAMDDFLGSLSGKLVRRLSI